MMFEEKRPILGRRAAEDLQNLLTMRKCQFVAVLGCSRPKTACFVQAIVDTAVEKAKDGWESAKQASKSILSKAQDLLGSEKPKAEEAEL